MNSRWDDLWPIPEPPEDFALNVLVKSLETRQNPQRPWRWVLAALVPSLCLVFALSLSWKQHQDQAAKRGAFLEAQRRETEERLRRLQTDFEAATQRELELQVSLANAKDEVTRAKLQAQLEHHEALGAKDTRPSGALAPAARMAPAATPKKRSRNCSPGDPLCE